LSDSKKNLEHGVRELEPRPSKLTEKVYTAAILNTALKNYTNDKTLNQFSNKNITQQRKNDITSEKKSAVLERKQYRLEFKNTELRDENKAAKKELHALIKKEYGSVENYAKEKKKLNFQKSVQHTELSAKVAKLDNAIIKNETKLSHVSVKRSVLRRKRNDSLHFRAGDKVDGERSLNSLDSADKLERQAAKADNKLARANKSRNLPQHTIIRKSYQFDSETGKIQKKLIFDKEVKPLSGKTGIVTKALKGAGAVTALRLSHSIHRQISKNENDRGNEGAKAAHTGLRFAEHTAVKSARHAHKFLQERPYKKVSKLQLKSDKANAKLYAKRKGGSIQKGRQMKNHAKQYVNKAQQARKAVTRTEKFAKAIKAVGLFLKKLLFNPVVLKVLLIAALVVLIITILLTFLMALAGNSGAILGVYLAEDEQIYAAVDYAESYSETAVQNAINSVASSIQHDYLYIAPYTLEFNPYALISFLSAFCFSEVGDEYDNSFNATDAAIINAIHAFIHRLYYISYGTSVYTQYEIIGYDSDDYPIYGTVNYITLYIVVNRRTENEAAYLVYNSGSPYSPDMYDLYLIYMETLGFRPDLFPAYAN